MLRMRWKGSPKTEDLLLQASMLRGTVDRTAVLRQEFKEQLRNKLVYGNYPDENRGLRFCYFKSLYAALLCGILLIALFIDSPLVGEDRNLSVLASEIGDQLAVKSNAFIEMTDIYEDLENGGRLDLIWKIWKVNGDYSYTECWIKKGAAYDRLSRYIKQPKGSIFLDDQAKKARVTEFHGAKDDVASGAELAYFSPLCEKPGSVLPVNLPRQSMKLGYRGISKINGRQYLLYASDDRVKIWINGKQDGYFRIEDTAGLTLDPNLPWLGTGQVKHTLNVTKVKNKIKMPMSVFFLGVPDSYSTVETRDIYPNDYIASKDLGFRPILPSSLWKYFDKPKSYSVCTGQADARFEVVLFPKGQYRDVYSAIRLTQYKPAENADNERLKMLNGAGAADWLYGWAVNGVHLEAYVKYPTEYSSPEIVRIYEAVLAWQLSMES